MGWDPVSVEYEVADDESFRRVVTRGTALATRELAHSVHPEIRGLEAARWYFYRFRAGSAISPVGRTRTAPAPGQPTPRMRFAFASCQSWSSGYYTAYEQHMSTEGLDLVVHLGDYIYERGWRRGREGMSMGVDAGEAVDLPGYRLRYAQYKAEQPLRDAHAAFPWIVTMDDHEVDNNWAADSPGSGSISTGFPRCSAAAESRPSRRSTSTSRCGSRNCPPTRSPLSGGGWYGPQRPATGCYRSVRWCCSPTSRASDTRRKNASSGRFVRRNVCTTLRGE